MSFQAGFLGRRNREDRENKEDKENKEFREFREFKELRERVSLNSLNSLNSLIYHLNQRTNFLSEGIRYNARRISKRWAVLEVLLIAKIIR